MNKGKEQEEEEERRREQEWSSTDIDWGVDWSEDTEEE